MERAQAEVRQLKASLDHYQNTIGTVEHDKARLEDQLSVSSARSHFANKTRRLSLLPVVLRVGRVVVASTVSINPKPVDPLTRRQ